MIATRTRRALLTCTIAALGAVGTVALAAPGSAQAPAPIVRKVDVGDNFFKPKTLRIVAGTTVQWKNTGRNVHDIRPNKGKLFGLKLMPPGKKYKYTFTTPGKYAYYCSFHGSPGVGQYGTIIVTAPPATTTPST